MGKLRFIQVDVFTASPFGGNPVVVIPEPGQMTAEQMQRVARGMNFAETSYVVPTSLPDADIAIRGFTPTTEVAYSGHQLLGTAWALVEAGQIAIADGTHALNVEMGGQMWPVVLERVAGHVVQVSVLARPAVLRDTVPLDQMAEIAGALSVEPGALLRTGLPIEVVASGLVCLIVPISGLAAVRGLLPVEQLVDELLQRLGAECLVAFCLETLSPTNQVHARVFAPPLGVVEDAATGAANGALAAYLLRHGGIDVADGGCFSCEQGTEMGRPSRIDIRIDDADPPAIRVGGAVARSAEGTVFY